VAVCAMATVVPTHQSSTQLKPIPTMRVVADVELISKSPFIDDPQTEVGHLR
jgi:hypothetical protein